MKCILKRTKSPHLRPFTPRLSPNQLYKKKLKIYSFNNSTSKGSTKSTRRPILPFNVSKRFAIEYPSFKKGNYNFSGNKYKNLHKPKQSRTPARITCWRARRRKNNSSVWATLRDFHASSSNNKQFQSETSHKNISEIKPKSRDLRLNSIGKGGLFCVNLYQTGRSGSRVKTNTSNKRVGLGDLV